MNDQIQKDHHNKILYLIGKPGTGKYTISQELAKYGYIVCDNHLINNPILTLLSYDGFRDVSESLWFKIDQIRDIVFDFLIQEPYNNYILTNVLYDIENDYILYKKVEQMAEKRQSLFAPIKLHISEEENLRRIVAPSRKLKYKSINPKDVYTKHPLIHITHPNLLVLDITTYSVQETAEAILNHVSALQQ